MKNEIPVIFENEFVIALNKPPGLSVQGGEKVKRSLDSILEEKYERKLFLVHRLDKDTSGLILVAKTKQAAAALSKHFQSGIKKFYLAVSAGIPVPAEGNISLPLEIRGRILKSFTSYKVIKSASTGGENCSLLELELGSGRMHQIRRHLASVGNPVLGDDKYGNFSLNRHMKKNMKIKSLMLHSHRLLVKALPPFIPAETELISPPPNHFTNLRLDNGLSFFSS